MFDFTPHHTRIALNTVSRKHTKSLKETNGHKTSKREDRTLAMTSRCILTHIQKLPRSNNHLITRNINLASHRCNEFLNHSNVAALQHGISNHNHGSRHSIACKNFSSQSQQQEPSMFDRVKSNLGLSSKKESDEAAQFNRLAKMESK